MTMMETATVSPRKGKREKKRKLKEKDVMLLEKSPSCPVSFQRPSKDGLQSNMDEQAVDTMTDGDDGRSKGHKVKKKKRKNKEIAEQQEEDVTTEVQAEVKERKKRKKEKLNEEEVNVTSEETPNVEAPEGETVRKNKRKSKKDDGIMEKHAEGEVNVTSGEVAEMPNHETLQGETVRKKKKKSKKQDVQRLEEAGILENRIEGEVNVTSEVTVEMQNPEMPQEQTSKKRRSKKHPENDVIRASAEKVGDTVKPLERKRYKGTEIDDTLLNELKEFLPNVESMPPITISIIIKYDLPRFREFKRQGICLRRGKFFVEENERLRQNVRDFLALTGIESATKLFHPDRFCDGKEKSNIKKLKRHCRFYAMISEGLTRLCHDVYVRGRKIFDPNNYKGRFTKDEVHSLRTLQTVHGNKWKKIGDLTGRSRHAVLQRFLRLGKANGPWTEKELRKLQRAVREYLMGQLESGDNRSSQRATISRQKLYCNLPWLELAHKVKTRTWTQCRVKWMGILKAKMSSWAAIYKGKKSIEAKIRLIKAMHAMEIEDAADINWEDLTHTFGDVPPAYVQAKFHKLKVTRVPDWKTMSFGDTIDFLCEKVLPKFEEELKGCPDEAEEELTACPDEGHSKENQKERFLLSEIFDNIDEDDDDDDDSDEEEEEDGGGKQKDSGDD